MALVPGSPGSYNPGGGGGYGTNPWLGFMLFPVGAGMGLRVGKVATPLVTSGAKAVGGFTLRQTARQLMKTAHGYRNPWVAYQTIGETMDLLEAIDMGLTIYDMVEGSSSQDLVQNGGPPAPLQVSSTHSDILSLGKIFRPTRSSSAKRVIRPKSRKGRRKRCPPGHRWNGRMCVPVRKRS